MELLLDNLRNALFKGKHVKVKEITIPDKLFILGIAITLGLSFLTGRSAMINSLEPVSIALIMVLLSRSKGNIYVLPFIFIGILSSIKGSYHTFGDILAFLICTFTMVLPVIRRLPMTLKVLITATVMIITKVIYYISAGVLFLYHGEDVAIELLLLLAFSYVFLIFFQILDMILRSEKHKEQINQRIQEKYRQEGIPVFITIILLAAGGLPVTEIGPISILHIIAFLITLIIGYCMGTGEGGLAGILAGFIIMLFAVETPAIIGILGCCGAVAGIFSGKLRWVTGICFAGTALIFGAMKGFPALYFSIYEPLFAAAVFIFAPGKTMEQVVKLLSFLKKDDNYNEFAARKKVKDQIKEYSDLFCKLALSSGSMGAYHPSRDIMSRQFKGMSKALEKISADISSQGLLLQPKSKRFELAVGMAGYAKEGKISGDSCLYTYVNPGEYLIALSDGMGQGVRASEESNLTVNTLYNLVKAGFEVELALQMVNSILLQKPKDEIFSTLDMGFINLYTGRIKIFKIGAAAGFIKRGDVVKTIKVPALPLGIIEKIPMESISLQLKKGDMFIMVSDGISEAERGSDGPEWVGTAVSEIKSRDPQTVADLIINQAVQKYGIREKDDMTALVVAIN